jgi:hypothetical protein
VQCQFSKYFQEYIRRAPCFLEQIGLLEIINVISFMQHVVVVYNGYNINHRTCDNDYSGNVVHLAEMTDKISIMLLS